MSKFTRLALLCLSFGLAVGLPVASLTPIVKAQMSQPSSTTDTSSATPTSTAKPRHKHKKSSTSTPTPSSIASPTSTP